MPFYLLVLILAALVACSPLPGSGSGSEETSSPLRSRIAAPQAPAETTAVKGQVLLQSGMLQQSGVLLNSGIAPAKAGVMLQSGVLLNSGFAAQQLATSGLVPVTGIDVLAFGPRGNLLGFSRPDDSGVYAFALPRQTRVRIPARSRLNRHVAFSTLADTGSQAEAVESISTLTTAAAGVLENMERRGTRLDQLALGQLIQVPAVAQATVSVEAQLVAALRSLTGLDQPLTEVPDVKAEIERSIAGIQPQDLVLPALAQTGQLPGTTSPTPTAPQGAPPQPLQPAQTNATLPPALSLTVQLIKPAGTLSTVKGNPVALEALITNPKGESVAKVEFIAGGKILGESTQAPYAFSWNTTGETAGNFSVRAIARGPGNAFLAESATVSVSLTTAPLLAPSVTTVNLPAQSLNNADITVTVLGANFVSGASLRLGSLILTNVAVDSLSQIRGTIPANTAKGVYSGLTLTNPDGQSATGTGTITLIQRYHVKAGATGANNGSSWKDAYSDLQPALAAASSGDEIWVAAGAYKPSATGDRAATFQLKSGVTLLGGFAGTETSALTRNPTTNVTTLSGDLSGNDAGFTNFGENSYHVLKGANNATLDGFTVKGGNADGAGLDDDGGGMRNDDLNSTLTLNNVIFTGNSALASGGGMLNKTSSPKLTNVTFTGNRVTGGIGGGLANTLTSSPALTSVTFSSNTASASGGGLANDNSSAPVLSNVTFTSNSASANGGGMANFTNAAPSLTNVSFNTNSATLDGGGVYNDASAPVLKSVTFTGNTAVVNGGGMFNGNTSSPSLTNVTFASNQATGGAGRGGGIYNGPNSNPSLTTVTFSSNSAALEGGGIYNTGASPTLNSVTFTSNTAANAGGAIFLTAASTPVLSNINFTSNSVTAAGSDGGALHIGNSASPVMTNLTFTSNTAVDLGGAFFSNNASPSLSTATFTSNSAPTGDGGAMALTGGGTVSISNATFTSNSATESGAIRINGTSPTFFNVQFITNSASTGCGGAIENYGGGSPTLTNAIFRGNSAASCGGAVLNAATLTLANVLFANNSTAGTGGALYNTAATTTVTHGTFSNNSATANDSGALHLPPAGGTVTILNSILWSATAISVIVRDAGNLTINDSIVKNLGGFPGGTTGGNGESAADPLFVNPGDPDGTDNLFLTADDGLRLQAASPAIDIGSVIASLDILGVARLGNNDAGAYEKNP